MYCEKCGGFTDDDARFCNYCGESLTRKAEKSTTSCDRCGGTGKARDGLGFIIRCPVCKGSDYTEEM